MHILVKRIQVCSNDLAPHLLLSGDDNEIAKIC